MDSCDVEVPLAYDGSSEEELAWPAPRPQLHWKVSRSILLTLGVAVGLFVVASQARQDRTMANRVAVAAAIELSQPAALKHFEFVALTPCLGEGQLMGSEQQHNEEDCAQNCMDTPNCHFIAFCPRGKAGCTGLQDNNCVRYSSCGTMDTAYSGYSTRKYVEGPALERFKFYSPEPCDGEGRYLGGERQESEEKCAATCKEDLQCLFMAYCPSGKTGCEGPQENNCVRYSSCDVLNSNYHGYTTRQKV